MKFVISFLIFLLVVLSGFYAGADAAKDYIRENTINYCIEKPAECKKEYNFNKTKVEIQKLQEETAK